ncbi:DUF6273 domain-containing protein [Spirosoma endophyticum]|uniref:DUF6273 domain-containing protein n=1 Tax=Spirosoma endophyticum TaxID=662367 RepID=A0A1I1SA76_9BACT|nr:DUF6273 domain-containing protein [Spirosoma endophyticum]SFD43287.1 hypothetical protein SAMN05216167_10525 [Spirosoma endophyticum]
MIKHDLVSFGLFTWRVLAIEEGQRALIITQDIVELRWYHQQFVNITWADCALRQYLNQEFFRSFSPQEQAKIIQVTNKNIDNPWFNTAGGPDTTDHLFLLSLQEACRYFGDSQAKLNHKGGQTWLIDDPNNINRQARYGTDLLGWRLRSPGYYGRTGASITKHGHIYVRGNGVFGRPRDGGGIRPALWLRLED